MLTEIPAYYSQRMRDVLEHGPKIVRVIGDQPAKARHADGTPARVMRVGETHRSPPPTPPRATCAYLGKYLGDVKVKCGESFKAQHECLCPDRPAKFSRKGTPLAPKALPGCDCRHLDGTVLQPCQLCSLWEPAVAEPPPAVE